MKANRIIPILLFLFLAVSLLLYADQARKNLQGKASESSTASLPTSSLEKSISTSPAMGVRSEEVVSEVSPQLQILREIFETKNDNDPRMDTDLKNLSRTVKTELVHQYSEINPEQRNERGTIVFLIGREVMEGRGSLEDVAFLKQVLLEKPCLSLQDCSKSPSGGSAEEQHLEAIHETTANYPQLTDLASIRKSFEQGNLSAEIRTALIGALESAKNSTNPRVVQEAQRLLNQYSHP